MDDSQFEYTYSIAIVWRIMYLYSNQWKPDVYIPNEMWAVFTEEMEQAACKMWLENRSFVNEMFDMITKKGNITLWNFEDGATFVLKLLLQSEYHPLVLLRSCVVVSSYAALFYIKGLQDSPIRAMELLCDSITELKHSGKFTSWMAFQRYCKEYASYDTCLYIPAICITNPVVKLILSQNIKSTCNTNVATLERDIKGVSEKVLEKLDCCPGDFTVENSKSPVIIGHKKKSKLSSKDMSESAVAKELSAKESCVDKDLCTKCSLGNKTFKTSNNHKLPNESLGYAVRIENSFGQIMLSKLSSRNKVARSVATTFSNKHFLDKNKMY